MVCSLELEAKINPASLSFFYWGHFVIIATGKETEPQGRGPQMDNTMAVQLYLEYSHCHCVDA